jgi:photosystem II stability/assembly factor-like uncharacterized protein
MCYRDGNLWIGWKSLFLSRDQGRTFSQIPITLSGAIILDVCFYDQNTGIVTTTANVLVTSDQGASWTPIMTSGNGFCADFLGTANDMIVVGPGMVTVSRDGGNTWGPNNGLQGSVYQVIARRGSAPVPGKACIPVEFGNAIHMHTTTDYGATWVASSSSTLPDSYAFAPDSCDQNTFYVANEAAYAPLSTRSIVWTTRDNGTTWINSQNYPRPYFQGSIATGLLAIYVPTIKNGMWRSTDHGTTWQSIGGPSLRPDNRLLSVITDNIIVAVDSNGSIWRTTNSGGSPVDVRGLTQPPAFNPSTLFGSDILAPCDSPAVKSVVLVGKKCTDPIVVSQTIHGPDASHYKLMQGIGGPLSGLDSLVLSFTADSARAYDDTLVIQLSDGTLLKLPLLGRGRKPGQSIRTSPAQLFSQDTLSLCDSIAFEFISIRDSACVLRSVLSQSIVGGGLHYEIVKGLPQQLTGGDDSIEVTFTGDNKGAYPATLRIVLDDSTVIIIPLLGNGKNPSRTIQFQPPTLFIGDSLVVCDSLHPVTAQQKLIVVSQSCLPIAIASQSITGPDSSAFILLHGVPSVLSGSDTCMLSITARKLGSYQATLILTLSDGTKLTVPLSGYGVHPVNELSLVPQILFVGDTIQTCGSSLSGSFVLFDSTCSAHHILSESIAGADSLSYKLNAIVDSLLGPNGDSISVQFVANAPGDHSATLVVVLDDSTRLSISLAGTVRNARYPVSYFPTKMFGTDTASTCGPAILQPVVLQDTSCPARKIFSEKILGRDSMHYTIRKSFGLQAGPDPDSSNIVFSPDSVGSYASTLEVVFDDGSNLDIPLAGTGDGRIHASIATLDVEQDTIGAVASVPIILHRSGPVPDMRFVVHYDTAMCVYQGAINNLGGGSADVRGMQSLGRSTISISVDSMSTDSIIGYVNLEVFPTTKTCATVTFDSAEFSTSGTMCASLLNDSAVATVCSAISCGTETLSEFLRYNNLVQLSAWPNPASDLLVISSSLTLGTVSIELVDALGILRSRSSVRLIVGQPVEIGNLPESGIYMLRVAGNPSVVGKQVLIVR